MKTRFHLENFNDLELATSPVRKEGDTMPILTVKLECFKDTTGDSVVRLQGDPHFCFSMPLHEFLNEAVRRLKIPSLCNTVGVKVSTNP